VIHGHGVTPRFNSAKKRSSVVTVTPLQLSGGRSEVSCAWYSEQDTRSPGCAIRRSGLQCEGGVNALQIHVRWHCVCLGKVSPTVVHGPGVHRGAYSRVNATIDSFTKHTWILQKQAIWYSFCTAKQFICNTYYKSYGSFHYHSSRSSINVF
jgi:hypothetical protein